MSTGTTIAKARKSHGWSMATLGRAVGVGRSTVHRWESDQALPPLKRARHLARVLGVTVEKLVGGR